MRHRMLRITCAIATVLGMLVFGAIPAGALDVNNPPQWVRDSIWPVQIDWSQVYPDLALSQLRGTETEPTVQFILSALELQEGLAGGRLELEAVCPHEDGDTPQTSYHYIRTPQMLWMETFYDKSTMQEAYDRVTYETRSRSRMKDTGMESCIVFYSENHPKLDTLRVLDVARTMRPKIAKGILAEQMETIDGHSCWRIDLPPYEEGLASYSIWVDAAIGFCPRRREIHQTDQSFTIAQYRDYREVSEGVWIPMTAELEAEYHNVPPGVTEPVLRVVKRVTVRQVRVGDAVPSPPAVEVPAGLHKSVGPDGETIYTTPEPIPPERPNAPDNQETEEPETEANAQTLLRRVAHRSSSASCCAGRAVVSMRMAKAAADFLKAPYRKDAREKVPGDIYPLQSLFDFARLYNRWRVEVRELANPAGLDVWGLEGVITGGDRDWTDTSGSYMSWICNGETLCIYDRSVLSASFQQPPEAAKSGPRALRIVLNTVLTSVIPPTVLDSLLHELDARVEGSDEVMGHACYRIRAVVPYDGSDAPATYYRAWVAPDLDYGVVRYEFVSVFADGLPRACRIWRASDWVKPNEGGMWYPKHCQEDHFFYLPGDACGWLTSTVVALQHLTTHEAEVDSKLCLRYPFDTRVIDREHNLVIDDAVPDGMKAAAALVHEEPDQLGYDLLNGVPAKELFAE